MTYFVQENGDLPCLHTIKQSLRLTTGQYNFSSSHSEEPKHTILHDHIQISYTNRDRNIVQLLF